MSKALKTTYRDASTQLDMYANYEEMSKHLWQEHMNTEARVQFQEQEQRYLAERRDYIKRIDEMR